MAATSFEIKETILSLPKKSETDVYHTELNIVSWFGKEPKLDIRGWSDDHEKMTKGISLTEDEFIKIARTGLEKLVSCLTMTVRRSGTCTQDMI